MTMRLTVDWTACEGRGLCGELLPELLDQDPWGYPMPREGGGTATVPAELTGHARRATRVCPTLALRLRRA
jgi:ferredoxin